MHGLWTCYWIKWMNEWIVCVRSRICSIYLRLRSCLSAAGKGDASVGRCDGLQLSDDVVQATTWATSRQFRQAIGWSSARRERKRCTWSTRRIRPKCHGSCTRCRTSCRPRSPSIAWPGMGRSLRWLALNHAQSRSKRGVKVQKLFPSVLWHCWSGDRKGFQPVEYLALAISCWFFHRRPSD